MSTTTQVVRRQNVQQALHTASIAPTGNTRDYAALDWMLDRSTPQTKAAILCCMKVAMANNTAGEHIMDRCEEELEPLYECIGTETGDPDVEMSSLWLSLLTGLRTGYADSL